MGQRVCAILLLASLGAACGASHTEERPSTRTRPERTASRDRDPEPLESDRFDRSIRGEGTWADLVAVARRLDDVRADTSEAGCLLDGDRAAGFRLRADLAVAVRPLAGAEPRTLGALGPQIAIVSRWGAVQPATTTPETPRLVADFTLTRPPGASARHVVLGVARDEMALVDPGTRIEPIEPRTIATTLRANGATYVHLVADADVPLARIAAVLDALDESGVEVALAVLLPDGARAPDAGRAGGDGPALCPDGLPDPGGDATPDTRELMAIRQALGPLRQAAESCRSSAMTAGIGAVDAVLALRIEPDGTVPDACVVEESRPAGSLRRCLVAAARGIVFPPSPSRGALVLELPFSLRASEAAAQRARCR